MALDSSVDAISKQCNFTEELSETLAIISKKYNVSAIFYDEPWKAPGVGIVVIVITDLKDTAHKRFNCEISSNMSERIFNFHNLTNVIKSWYASVLTSGASTIARLMDVITKSKPSVASDINSMLDINSSTTGVPKLDTTIDKISKEICTRGDFELDIPKLVDVLFKLGCIKSKED